jgi:hypothetical protein
MLLLLLHLLLLLLLHLLLLRLLPHRLLSHRLLLFVFKCCCWAGFLPRPGSDIE